MPQVNFNSWLILIFKFFMIFFMLYGLFHYFYTFNSLKKMISFFFYAYKNLI